MNRTNTPSASEVCTFIRTSVSVDEAVAMLMGWITGPVKLSSNSEDPSEEEEALIDAYFFDLDERIRDIREGLDADLSWAERDGQPSEAERLRRELSKLKETETRAFAYRCAIDDELNRGAESELRVDKTLPNDAVTYITIASFDQWARKQYNRQFLDMPQQASEGAHLPSKPETETAKTRTRFRDQEKAILAGLSELGYDPKQLPKNRPGLPGAKWKVRDKLAANPLLKGSKVFDKAWERLQKDKDIAYA